MQGRISVIVVFFSMWAFSAARSAPTVIDFAFYGSEGSVLGNITGELDFAGYGTNIGATSIYVYNSAGIGRYYGSSYDLVSNGTVYQNTFSVNTSGMVTSADLYAAIGNEYLLLNYSGSTNQFAVGSNYTRNNNGFAGVTYTNVTSAQAPAPVSEPVSLAVFASTLIAAAVCRFINKGGRRLPV